jgi:DNA-directed RNA polymerase specialized sigma24 family protein
MPKIDRIEMRLVRWAEYVTVGDGSGYPSKSVLHDSWMPPTPGTTTTLKVAAPTDARQTHRAIGFLSRRLANTVVMHYVLKPAIDEQAERLGCAIPTVYTRVEQAHRQLQQFLSAEEG